MRSSKASSKQQSNTPNKPCNDDDGVAVVALNLSPINKAINEAINLIQEEEEEEALVCFGVISLLEEEEEEEALIWCGRWF